MIGSSDRAGSVMKTPWAIALRARSRSLISVSARRLGAMSTKVTTAPRVSPSRRIGWARYSTGIGEPSALQKTSSSPSVPSPVRKVRKIGHSSAG